MPPPTWPARVRLALTAAGIAAAGPAAFSAPALAQMDSREGIALQNQIYELRRDLQSLQSQGGGGGAGGSVLGGRPPPVYSPSGAPNGDMVAQLLGRVQSLEEQVRQLRGQLDSLSYQTQRQSADTTKQIEDLNYSLGGGAGGAGGAAGGGAAPPPRTPAPPRSPPPNVLGGVPDAPPPPAGGSAPPSAAGGRRTPELALQEGHAALGRRDYAGAESAAREVLGSSRTSPRAYDAQLLLAQALAGQRNFPQAAIAYDDAYNRSRTGSHAPDALLGLANSLAAINEKRAACETLSRLNTEFPRPGGDVRDGAAGLRQRVGCR